MKTWIIVVAVVVLLALVGIAVANVVQSDSGEAESGASCEVGPTCENSCTSNNYCSSPSCGARTGSGCGCR